MRLIKALLDTTNDISVVSDTANGLVALRLTEDLHPDVVVVDISFPDISGIEVTRRIKENTPDIFVLALSMHNDRRYIIEIMNSGANGFLLKDCAAEELVIAIRAIKAGKTYLSPSISGMIVYSYIRQEQAGVDNSCSIAQHTPREIEILTLFTGGKSTKEIAFHFGLRHQNR